MLFVRWILGFILTLSIVLALAVVLLPRWFNPNDYRDDIELQLNKATGREIALDGNLQLSVFPWLGVRTEAVKVSQPREIGGDFMRIDSAQIRLQLMPLLNRRIELDTILLDGAYIHYISVNEQLNSLTFNDESTVAVAAINKGSSGADSAANSASPSNVGFSANDVFLKGVDVRNATLDYEDRSAKSRTKISEFNANIGSVLSGELTPFSLSGVLQSAPSTQSTSAATASALPTRFTADGNVIVGQEGKSIVVSDLKSTLDDSEQKIDIASAKVSVADFARINAQNTKINISSTSIALPIELNAPDLSVDLESEVLQMQNLVALLGLTASRTTINVSDLVVRDAISDPKYTLNLNVPTHSLLNTLKALDIDYQPTGKQALKKVAIKAKLTGTSDSVKVSNGVVNLDSSVAAISGQVNNFSDPAFRLDLEIDSLNLDDYLPLDESGETTKAEETSLATVLVLPMAVFEGFVADAKLSVKSLSSGGMTLDDVVVDVKSDKAKVVIKPRANLFEGKLAGDIAYGQEFGVPTLRIKNEIDLVSLGELLSSAQITDQLTGLGSLVMDLVVTERDGKQFNEGTIKLFAKNGALKGVDVKNVLDTTYAQYKTLQSTLRSKDSSAPLASSDSQPAASPTSTATDADAETSSEAGTGKSSAADETRFAELLGTFNVKDFLITNTDFSLSAPLFKVTGAGLIDIAAEQIDYTVNVAVVNNTSGQAGEAIEKLKGFTIPIRFSGALLAPKFSVDTKALYRSLLKRDVDTKKGAFLQEKYGIEGGENLSTKETAKQILLDKLLKPNKEKTPATQERSMTGNEGSQSTAVLSAGAQPANSSESPVQESVERPMQPRATSEVTDPAIAATIDPATGEAIPAEPKPLDKDALKKELGKKLLDELFK